MKRWTVDELMAWFVFYSRERVTALVGDGLTALEIADLDIPARDRLWILLREDFIPNKELRLLACEVAQDAVTRSWTVGLNPQDAIDTARRFARGEAAREDLSFVSSAWTAQTCAHNSAQAVVKASAEDAAKTAVFASANAAVGDAAIGDAWADSLTQSLAMTRSVLVALSEVER
jgi:hypothetical protein